MKVSKIIVITFLVLSSGNFANAEKKDSLQLAITKANAKIDELDFKFAELQKNEKSLETIAVLLKVATYTVEGLVLLTVLYGIGHIFSFYHQHKKIERKLAELKERQDKIKIFSEKINKIDKSVSGNQTYIKHGFENVFDLVVAYINNGKNQKFKEMALRKKAVSDLYSLNEEDNFRGIADLSQYGTESDINLIMESTILNSSASKSNKIKKLASEAIVEIRMRKKS